MIIAIIWLATLAITPEPPPEPEPVRLIQTMDQRGVGRCGRGGYTADVSARFVGATVRLRCRLNAQGGADHCEVLNPTRAALRHEAVFQCMASHISWRYSDGSSTEGVEIRTTLDVRGMW